jgi:hypothetical protein
LSFALGGRLSLNTRFRRRSSGNPLPALARERDHGVDQRDRIDVQSFIWVVGAYTEGSKQPDSQQSICLTNSSPSESEIPCAKMSGAKNREQAANAAAGVAEMNRPAIFI